MAGKPILDIDGKELSGWQSINITRGLLSFSPAFTLQVDGLASDIRVQDEFALHLESEHGSGDLVRDKVASGFISKCRSTHAASGTKTLVSGRGKAGKMLKSQARAGRWHGDIGIDTILNDVAAPFGVTVSTDFDHEAYPITTALSNFRLIPGELAAEAIQRVAMHLGVLVVNQGDGSLVLTDHPTVTSPTALVRGKNIIDGEYIRSDEDLNSVYVCESQMQVNQSSFNDSIDRTKHAEIPGILHSPGQLCTPCNGSHSQIGHFAEWQALLALSYSEVFRYRIDGWELSRRQLWQPNMVVRVEDEAFGLDNDDLLIAQVDNHLSRGRGATTTLTLIRSPYQRFEDYKSSKFNFIRRQA